MPLENKDMFVGQIVRFDPSEKRTAMYQGEDFRVTKVNSVNVKVEGVDSNRRVNVSPFFLIEKDDDPLAKAGAKVGFIGTPYVAPPKVSLGSTVRLTHNRFGPADAIYVVIAIKQDKTNVARLGGDNDRYIRVPHAMVVPVEVEATVVA